MVEGELAEHFLAAGREAQKDETAVLTRNLAADVAGLGEPIDQLDRAVMLDVQAWRKLANTRPHFL